MTTTDDPGARLYLAFAEIFNARAYDRLGEVLTPDFTDHHPGLVDVAGLAEYRRNLAFVVEALDMRAEPRDVASAGEMVYTRVKLTGRHVGAEEMKEFGLVNEIVPAESLMTRAHELADVLIAASPSSLTRAKWLLTSAAAAGVAFKRSLMALALRVLTCPALRPGCTLRS